MENFWRGRAKSKLKVLVKIKYRIWFQQDRRKEPEMAEVHPDEQMMQVIVPAGVGPGMPFQVDTPAGPMQVTCPPNAAAGSQMMFNVPAAPQPVAMAVPMMAVPMADALSAACTAAECINALEQIRDEASGGHNDPTARSDLAAAAKLKKEQLGADWTVDVAEALGQALRALAEGQPASVPVVAAQPMTAAPQPMVMQRPMMEQPPMMGQPVALGAVGGGLPWKVSLNVAEKTQLSQVKASGQSPIPVISANEWREIVEALDALQRTNFFYDCPCCELAYWCIPLGPVQSVLCILNPVTCILCIRPMEAAKTAAKAKIEPIVGKYGLKFRIDDTMAGMFAFIEQ